LIDRSNHHLFQPLLYQVATAGLSGADIAVPIRSILRRQPNAAVLMAEVTGVDPARKRVLIGSGHVEYDYLILATGATHSYFGHEEWEKFAPGLKTLGDAMKIREQVLSAFEKAELENTPEEVAADLTIVIVGAGPTGVEVAGSIGELTQHTLKSDFRKIDPRRTRVILLEAGPRILSSFPEDLANIARRKLEESGIEVLTQAAVEQIDERGVVAGGRFIPAKTVIWAAGVQASPAGKWLGCPLDRAGRARVQPDLTVPGHPEVFLIGDAACVLANERPLPGLASVALQQGMYVASVLKARVEGQPEGIPPFRYLDKGNLATLGRRFAIADLHGIKLYGVPGWLVWVGVHIYYLIGFRTRFLVLLEWAWAYFTYQSGARLITAQASAGETKTAEKRKIS
jgi:NADH dehydrogenase